MSVSTKLITAIDSLIYAFRSGIKKNLKDYSELESVLNPTTLVASDGSLVTVFEIYGSRKYIGSKEIEKIEEGIYSALKSSLSKEGHQLQFVFSKDKDRVKDHLKEVLLPYRRTAHNLGLKLDDLFDSKEEHLQKFCSFESSYLAVWSKPELIKESLSKEKENVQKRSEKSPLFINAQNVIIEYERLEASHNAFCEVIGSSLGDAEINAKKIHVVKAIKDIRRAVDYKHTALDWEPSLPMLKDELNPDEKIAIPLRDEKSFRASEKDVSDLLWPSVSSQVFPVDIDVVENDIIKMGQKHISSMHVDIPPQNIKPFKALMDSIDADIPIQISFTLESGGLNKARLKAMAASILAVTNSGNKMVRDSVNYLRDLEQEGESIVKLSINATTWSDDLSVLSIRKGVLQKKIESWGNSTVVINSVDPIEGYLSTVPALSYKTSGNASLAPLIDIIKMLPLTRQSHVWENGSVLFRTEDGKIFPYQTGSNMQSTWNDLIFAIPGSGKSVLMSSLNLATVLTPGAKELPLIGILDIGPSSSGFIHLLEDALADNKKHLVLHKKIQNVKEDAINIFDTMLGCRKPSPSHKVFLQNFLTQVITPAGKSEPYESTDAMIIKIVNRAYEVFSDDPDSTPKPYYQGVCNKVDEKLFEYGIDGEEEGLCWWEIVDLFFDKKEIALSSLAQRYAVPLLEELVEIATSSPSINNSYSKPLAKTGESMLELFQRAISEVIEEYPMLNLPTLFDVSGSRIISLDLDEVAKGSDAASIKRTGLMYLLGRNIVGSRFKINKDEVHAASNKKYLNYHLKIADKALETKKRLCLDEFHRTAGLFSVQNQVVTDQREGRKWNLQVVLASQLVTDFTKDMIHLSTGAFLLSGGDDDYEALTKMFNLNDSTSEIVRKRLTGSSSVGVPFIFNTKTKNGAYSQFLYSTISPVELWAFNTTAEDVVLRRKLSEELGSISEARSLLAKTFKGGSAKKYIEKLQLGIGNKGVVDDPYQYLIERMKTLNKII